VTGGSSFFFSPSEVSAGRNYQGMLLSHFAHADGTHLLFNMMTLYFFCIVLIPDIRALGASDSVTGIIFAAIVLLPGMSVYFFVVPVPIPAPLFAVGYIVLSTYLMRRGAGISVTKHTLPARSQDYFSRDCWRRGDSARSFTEFRISSLERKRLLRLDRQPRETQHRHL
jgi:membrane associated rhomboid family serine protease